MGASRKWNLIRLALAGLAVVAGLALFASPAAAERTVWLCKPGQLDNPCVGTLAGDAYLPPDNSVDPPLAGRIEPLDFSLADKPPVDCFYLYPTQSRQRGLNADLTKDTDIRAVAINQARMFSRICNVYAPVYRQYTLDSLGGPGLGSLITPEVRDIAYNSALGAWNDYMDNYNNGRGVVVIGHSQGTSHMARLLAEEVDDKPAVRNRIISAILPGANVYVPKGEVVGGQFQNIPACESGDQTGCVIAYSMFTQKPNPGAAFGWVDEGYWINPAPRPDKDLFEVLCVNPARLAGDGVVLRPLANLPAFLGLPEPAKPWTAMPDFYRGDCLKAEDPTHGTVNWLNVKDIRFAGDTRTDLSTLVTGSGGNLHTGDINLALDSLVSVAATQSAAYVARERRGVVRQRAAIRKRLTATVRSARQLSRRAALAARVCKAKRRSCGAAARLGRQARQADRRVAALRRTDRVLTRKINSLVGPKA
jgi:hypothetical protein